MDSWQISPTNLKILQLRIFSKLQTTVSSRCSCTVQQNPIVLALSRIKESRKTTTIQFKLRWGLFVTYTIIQSIMRSEMCSLHLTHPSGAVGSWHCGARGAVGGLVPCSRVSPQSWTLPARAVIWTHNLGLPQVSSPTLFPLGHDCPKHHTCACVYTLFTSLPWGPNPERAEYAAVPQHFKCSLNYGYPSECIFLSSCLISLQSVLALYIYMTPIKAS